MIDSCRRLFSCRGQKIKAGRMNIGRFEIEPLTLLLVFVPVSIALELLHASPVWIFVASALAIIPLAGLMGKATEHLAEMNLLFTTFEVVSVALTVGIVSLVATDGESNWMEGVQLLAVYVILAIAFYFLP
jgi:Ca2+/H+ antiporter